MKHVLPNLSMTATLGTQPKLSYSSGTCFCFEGERSTPPRGHTQAASCPRNCPGLVWEQHTDNGAGQVASHSGPCRLGLFIQDLFRIHEDTNALLVQGLCPHDALSLSPSLLQWQPSPPSWSGSVVKSTGCFPTGPGFKCGHLQGGSQL